MEKDFEIAVLRNIIINNSKKICAYAYNYLQNIPTYVVHLGKLC